MTVNASVLSSIQAQLNYNENVLCRADHEVDNRIQSLVRIFAYNDVPQELINALNDRQISHLLHLMDIGLGNYGCFVDTYTRMIDEKAKSRYEENIVPKLVLISTHIQTEVREASVRYRLERGIIPVQDPFETHNIGNLSLIDTLTPHAVPLHDSSPLKMRYLLGDSPTLKDELLKCAGENVTVLSIKFSRRNPIPDEIGQITSLRVLELPHFSACEDVITFPETIVNLTSIPVTFRCILRNQFMDLAHLGEDATKTQIRILQNWIDAGTPHTPYWNDRPINIFWDIERFHIGQGHPVLATESIQNMLIRLFPQAVKLWTAEIETANRAPELQNNKRLVLYVRTTGKLFNLYTQAYHLGYCFPSDPASGDHFQKKLLSSLYNSLKISAPDLLDEAQTKIGNTDLEMLFINGKIAPQEWSHNRPDWKKAAFKIFSAWTSHIPSQPFLVANVKKGRHKVMAKNLHT